MKKRHKTLLVAMLNEVMTDAKNLVRYEENYGYLTYFFNRSGGSSNRFSRYVLSDIQVKRSTRWLKF